MVISFSLERLATRRLVGAAEWSLVVGRIGRGAGDPLVSSLVIQMRMVKNIKKAWRCSWFRDGISMVLLTLTAGVLAIYLVSSVR